MYRADADIDRLYNTWGSGPMANEKGPNIKKKQICKNCEGKGLLKKGDKVVKCQRCKGTGVR
jgi:DnaJ-class molecular chaperone